MVKISIAIDGPSAAGKSTIAKRVAKELGYIYIDTGAMYRCVALYVLNQGIDPHDEQEVIRSLSSCIIELKQDGHVFLNKEDVTDKIRTDLISKNASLVSSYEKVREDLVKRQQDMAKEGGVILDGRDIGTVVLKDAQLKIFQVASVETRARRRYEENVKRGLEADYETIEKEIIARDYNDSHREHSPLRQAEDALLLDTSDLTIEEVTAKVLELARNKENEE